jgi:hypothetical protein
VMPHFSRDNAPRIASYEWCGQNRDDFGAMRQAASRAMFDQHEAEQAARLPRGAAPPARPARGQEAW